MRFIRYIYKYTYWVTLPSYPTRETKVQLGMALGCGLSFEKNALMWAITGLFFSAITSH